MSQPPNKRLRLALLILAGLFTVIALFYAEENLRGKWAWERHLKQMQARGEKFRLSDLVPPPVPDDQNLAQSPLFRPLYDYRRPAVGPVVWNDSNGLAHATVDLNRGELPGNTNKLRLGSLAEGNFADIDQCAAFFRGNTNFPQAPTDAAPAQVLLVALGKYERPYEELRQAAATRPYGRFPVEYDLHPSWSILLPHLSVLRGWMVYLQARATAELALSNNAAAFEDLKLGWRITDSVKGEPILIDFLVRLAGMGTNVEVVREGIHRHVWNDAQLTEIQHYLADVDLLREVRLPLSGERSIATEGVEYLSGPDRARRMEALGANLGFSAFIIPRGWIYQNALAIAHWHENYIFPAINASQHRIYPRLAGEAEDSVVKSHGPFSIFLRLLAPALNKMNMQLGRTQSWVDEARIACAIEQYRLAHGKIPEKLEALVPTLLPTIPTDVIDGKPLRYLPQGDESYLLYSIGWNEKDEQGLLMKRKKGVSTQAELAEGDWVWNMQ